MNEEPHTHHWRIDDHGFGTCIAAGCPLGTKQFDNRWPFEIPERWSWNSAVYGGPNVQKPKRIEDDED